MARNILGLICGDGLRTLDGGEQIARDVDVNRHLANLGHEVSLGGRVIAEALAHKLVEFVQLCQVSLRLPQ